MLKPAVMWERPRWGWFGGTPCQMEPDTGVPGVVRIIGATPQAGGYIEVEGKRLWVRSFSKRPDGWRVVVANNPR